MSYAAFRDFLAGSEPYSGNLKKLTEWYLRTISEVDPDLVQQAFAVLLTGLPAELREETIAAVGAVVAEAFRKAGLPAADWIER